MCLYFVLEIEHFNISNNLLHGTIVEAIFKGHKLKVLDMSRNTFVSVISSSIGDLKYLRILRLNENKLSGSIPVALFKTRQIEELMLKSNELTGSIPTQIGNLKNVSILTMSHNSLEGNIPKELQRLQNLQLLHFHVNQLTGNAPDVTFQTITKETYITDCGRPSFLLDRPLRCEACTMCCNSEEVCQERGEENMIIWVEAILTVIVIPIAFIVLGAIILKMTRMLKSGTLYKNRVSQSLYSNESVYCFIFSKSKLAWTLYIVTASIQLWLFATYLHASNVKNKNTDFQFNFKCLGNSLECQDVSTIDAGGWVLFFVIVIFYLGRDFTMSCLQLLSSLTLGNVQLLVSGISINMLTLTAIVTSFKYNMALATKNTDLVTNAVILLFINDLDETFLSWLRTLAPDWTKSVLDEVYRNMEIIGNPPQHRYNMGRRSLGMGEHRNDT